VVDRVVADEKRSADRPCELRIRAHEVPAEEERRRRVVASQHREDSWRAGRVAAHVERQRDDVFPRLQPNELAADDRRRKRRKH